MATKIDVSSPPRRIAARRDYRGPAFLSQGFRPFFLGTGLWAVLAILIWLGEWLGLLPPLMSLNASWHAHEMIFGFASAAMAGFLLTAIPNWTGRLPVRGLWLGALASLWGLGRIVMLMPHILGEKGSAIIDAIFLIALCAAVWREILAGKNWRNIKTALLITLLASANLLFHWRYAFANADTMLAERFGVMTLVTLIALIGGRIIPSFTRNVLAKRGDGRLPGPVTNTDRFTLVATVITAISWTLYPQSLLSGGLCLIASALHLERLTRWRGLAILDEPMLWVLHLGYLWISIGFTLLSLHIVLNLVPQSAAIHAFTAGAFATMILGVMSRAARGHSGQPLKADLANAVMYVSITLAAITRIAGSVSSQTVFYSASGVFWVMAFGIFVIAYWKILTRDMRKMRA